jgi:hypothetical protein
LVGRGAAIVALTLLAKIVSGQKYVTGTLRRLKDEAMSVSALNV